MTAAPLHPAEYDERRLLAECRVQRTRRSGPGGQHRNKVETAVIISHTPTGVRAEASERRSQEENRRQAIFRLRLNLALAVRSDRGDSPSQLWQSRLRGGRIEVNPEHDDFPSLLAEAMDVLTAAEMDAGQAAAQLGCSSSQLIRFLKHEPRALQLVNQERIARGQHTLK
jgi:hypothetical protein